MKIEVKDLSFSYDKMNDVLSHISFTLDRPGLVCIIGPNGVGKSTLVKCMDKILVPTDGDILFDGTSIRDMDYKALSKFIGYVPVSTNDYFPMTVIETIMMGRHPFQSLTARTKDDFDAVYDILESMNIEHLAMRSFGDLSAGQHQRVAIARGLAQEPRLLILDEPTANLDARYQMMVTRLLKRISEERGMTVLMISHDLNIAAKFADSVILMTFPGTIYKSGDPKDVITPENIRYAYGVDCLVSEIEGRPHVVLLNELDDDDLKTIRGTDFPE